MKSATIRDLALAAQMIPWDTKETDVPFDARHAFKQAITADHYLQLLNERDELLAALQSLLSAVEFMTPNLDVLTGTDAIACQRELNEAKRESETAVAKATGTSELLKHYYAKNLKPICESLRDSVYKIYCHHKFTFYISYAVFMFAVSALGGIATIAILEWLF